MQCFGTKNVNRENSGIPPANRGCLAARRQHVFASASALRSLQSRSPAIETGRGNAVGGTPAAPLSPPLRSAPLHRRLHPRRRRALPVRRPTLSLAPCCSTTRKGGEGASGGAGHRGRGRHGGSGRRRRLPAEPGLSPCRPLSYPRPAGRRRRRRVGVGGQGDDPWGANLRRLA